MITPLPFGGGEGGGANWWLVCEVTPTGLLIIGEGLGVRLQMPFGRPMTQSVTSEESDEEVCEKSLQGSELIIRKIGV